MSANTDSDLLIPIVAVQRLVQRFPQLQRAGRLRRRNGTVIRGPAEFVVAQSPTALAA